MKKWLLPATLGCYSPFNPSDFLHDALLDVMQATVGGDSGFDTYIELLSTQGLELFRNAVVEEDTDERVEIPPQITLSD